MHPDKGRHLRNETTVDIPEGEGVFSSFILCHACLKLRVHETYLRRYFEFGLEIGIIRTNIVSDGIEECLLRSFCHIRMTTKSC